MNEMFMIKNAITQYVGYRMQCHDSLLLALIVIRVSFTVMFGIHEMIALTYTPVVN